MISHQTLLHSVVFIFWKSMSSLCKIEVMFLIHRRAVDVDVWAGSGDRKHWEESSRSGTGTTSETLVHCCQGTTTPWYTDLRQITLVAWLISANFYVLPLWEYSLVCMPNRDAIESLKTVWNWHILHHQLKYTQTY